MPKPVHSIKEGRVSCAIWRNTKEGAPPFDLTISRNYKKGEEWITTHSFSAYDLDSLEKVLRQARAFIATRNLEEVTAA